VRVRWADRLVPRLRTDDPGDTREWRKLTPYRRTALLRELPRRVKQIRKEDQ
jgi:hypothetical protein